MKMKLGSGHIMVECIKKVQAEKLMSIKSFINVKPFITQRLILANDRCRKLSDITFQTQFSATNANMLAMDPLPVQAKQPATTVGKKNMLYLVKHHLTTRIVLDHTLCHTKHVQPRPKRK